MSLNPYSNGRYSTSGNKNHSFGVLHVLILILMEDTLRELRTISILDVKKFGLNPYSNGRYSTRQANPLNNGYQAVLILILMEDTLRVVIWSATKARRNVLILILMEDTLRGYVRSSRS